MSLVLIWWSLWTGGCNVVSGVRYRGYVRGAHVLAWDRMYVAYWFAILIGSQSMMFVFTQLKVHRFGGVHNALI